MGQNLGQLQDFPAPDGVSLSILASSDPNADYDAGAIAAVLSGFTRRRRASTGPMLLISERGMSLRLDRDVTDPVQLGEIMDKLRDLAGRVRLR